MKTSDFDYFLPEELIAQTPVEPRDASRLLVLDRRNGSIRHCRFPDIIDFLQAGDVMVFNDSRVIPARLFGKRVDTGAPIELLLLRRLETGAWETLVRPGRRAVPGAIVRIDGRDGSITAEVVGAGNNGVRAVRFSDESLLPALGAVPLPPYIHVPLDRPERYQTVYARVEGSAAAPTAGLHFTPDLLHRIEAKGVRCLFVTLHIGLDTFQPVKEADPSDHVIHREFGEVGLETAGELARARAEGRRVICVGTTSARVLEQAAQDGSRVQPFSGWADLFILPGYRFRMVDALVTNFHLPRSTLLMMVNAFAGTGLINKAYAEAIARRYRFYSFGDAMLIL